MKANLFIGLVTATKGMLIGGVKEANSELLSEEKAKAYCKAVIRDNLAAGRFPDDGELLPLNVCDARKKIDTPGRWKISPSSKSISRTINPGLLLTVTHQCKGQKSWNRATRLKTINKIALSDNIWICVNCLGTTHLEETAVQPSAVQT